MKIELLVVGKTISKNIEACINDYVSRINHYMPFSITTIPNLKNTKNLSEEQQKDAEGDIILNKIGYSDYVILLDERGKEMRSIELAKWLQMKMNNSRNLIFIIGGPYGFSKKVYERSNEMISLSKLTFSHQMIRLLFVEQIYRACTIIRGEPYHHE